MAEHSKQEGADPSGQRPKVEIANQADGGVFYWVGKLYGFVLLILLAALCVAGVSTYSYFASKAPPPPKLETYADVVPAVSHIYAADGTLLGEFATEWREVVPYEEIPETLVHAFLAAEDHEFFDHQGLYFKGILRATWRNLVAGDFAQGGSTITQQVAKQFLGNEKSLTRKAKEAIVARRLEANYPKEAILSVYMNHIYLGNGSYGVQAAAERYFAKDLDELDVSEAALIAGLARAPSRDSPTANPDLALERRNDILDRMARHGFVDEAEAEAAKEEPLELEVYEDVFGDRMPYFAEHVRRYVTEEYGEDALMSDGLRIETTVEPVTDGLAQENVEFGARKQDKRQGWRGPEAYLDNEKSREIFLERSEKLYGDAPLEPGRRYLGMVVEAKRRMAKVRVGARTYDLPLENMRWAHRWSLREPVNDQTINDVRRALSAGDVIWVKKDEVLTSKFQDWLLAKGVNPRWRRPAQNEQRLERLQEEAEGRVVLGQVSHPQAAIFTADHRSGYVVAMSGGTDFSRSEYNRTVQACRQPGSTYKPIYYSKALDMGYGFDTVLNDVPFKVVNPDTGEVWVAENYDDTEDVQVSLEYALTFSKNVPSVEVFRKVGAERLEKWGRRLGFTTRIVPEECFHKVCSALALGAECTVLNELTRAFAIFARNGRWIDWTYVRRILDREGNVLEDNTVVYDARLTGAQRLDRAYATAGEEARQAIPARTAFLTTKLLTKVITHGFSSIVRQTGVHAAGKTGTSSSTMDTSFVGFTSRWITSVWLGDDMRQRPLGKDDAAYMTVVPMWARYMNRATEDHPNLEIPWEVPEGVNPRDRGEHSRGKRIDMPLVYKKHGRPPWKREDGEGGGGEDGEGDG